MAFKLRASRIAKATAYKSALYRVEYAEGCETNVYATDRAEAIARITRIRAAYPNYLADSV